MHQQTERNVAIAETVCRRCRKTWISRRYLYWKHQPEWVYCASCASTRWYEEQKQRFQEGRQNAAMR